MRSSTCMLGLLLLAILCGCAVAKSHKGLHNKAQALQAESAQIATHVANAEVESRGVPSGVTEADLDACLDELKEDVRNESIWEEAKDECLATLAPLIEMDNIYKIWRDHNRTLAVRCLFELTECNDRNELLVEDGQEVGDDNFKRGELSERMLKHPYLRGEKRARRSIPELDEAFYYGMMAPASSATRERRETIECSYDRCEELVRESEWTIGELQKNVSWCEDEINYRKASIMAYLRFSILYHQETDTCTPLNDECEDGLRRLKVTVVNGDVGDIPYYADLHPGWVAFADESASHLFDCYHHSLANALVQLANGNSSSLDAYLEERDCESSTSGDLGDETLCASKSYSDVYDVNPEDNYLFAIIPAGSNDGNTFNFFVFNGLRIFDSNNGSFVNINNTVDFDGEGKRSVRDFMAPREEIRSGRKGKRFGPYHSEVESCGCIGDELPSFVPHESWNVGWQYFTLNVDGSSWTENDVATGGLLLIVEELRFTVPYPPGIRPEVRDLPSQYPDSYLL